MVKQLIEVGFFRPIVTEGRQTYILNTPITVVLSASVLRQLQALYPIDRETGGFLFAFPDQGKKLLTVNKVVELPNQLKTATSYSPNGNAYRAAIQECLQLGGLPIRWHSHPLKTGFKLYETQPLNFFQKTSDADRHNSYLPLTVDSFNVVLPDGLLSANDRDGKDVRFYLYNGFISPISRAALLVGQQVFAYGAGAFVLILLGLNKFGYKAFVWLVVFAALVYVNEERKRPNYSKGVDGSLLISFN